MFKQAILQNNMFSGIMGINEFIRFQETLTINDRKDIVLVSITEPDNNDLVSDNPTYTIGFHDIIEIKFWDVDSPIHDTYYPITKVQGKILKDFILANYDKKFLIHCKAGISRSAGVAKAVECLLIYDGNIYDYRTSSSEIDQYPRYHPNPTVFDAICDESFICVKGKA
jgi:predicted protein tyrosine phosphatase